MNKVRRLLCGSCGRKIFIVEVSSDTADKFHDLCLQRKRTAGQMLAKIYELVVSEYRKKKADLIQEVDIREYFDRVDRHVARMVRDEGLKKGG